MARTTIPSLISVAAGGALLLALAVPLAALGQDEGCQRCHDQYQKKKYVHAALEKGCAACHPGYGNEAPHRPARARVPGTAAIVAACQECHERKWFEGKFVHAPVESDSCLLCHDAHASDYPALGAKPPAALCLDCHDDIGSKPHVLAGFSGRGHPVGVEPEAARDPLRPGKTFYCGSCHEVHRGAYVRLMHFDLRSSRPYCQECHKK